MLHYTITDMKIKLKFPRITKSDLSWVGFGRLVGWFSGFVLNTFLLLFIGFEYLSWSGTTGSILYLYYAVIILLGFLTVQKLLLKGDFFPMVGFDIESLIFVSSFAISLFISIVVFQTKQNVWGGAELRSLSGLSIVSLWFVFYIIASYIVAKKSFNKAFTLFFIAPIVALLAFVFNLKAVVTNTADVIVLMQIGFIWLTFSKTNTKWLGLINLILSCILIFWATATAQVITLAALLFSLIVYVYTNRKNLAKYIVQLDKSTREFVHKKMSFPKLVSTNPQMFIFTVLILTMVVALFAVLNNPTRIDIIPYFVKGFNSVSGSQSWQTALFGHGLKSISASTAFTVIYSFGVLPIITFIFLAFRIIKTLIKSFHKINNNAEGEAIKGKFLILFVILINILVYMIFGHILDVVVVLFWVVLALISALIDVSNKRDIIQTNELYVFKDVTDESIKEFKEFLQKLFVLIFLTGLIYIIIQIGQLTTQIS